MQPPPELVAHLRDPLGVARFYWPEVNFYQQQRDIIRSVRDNDETFVVAGNKLGKDYVAGFIALGAFLFPNVFLRPRGSWIKSQEVRIITTSVKDDHLRVLWGEIGRFIQQCKYPLLAEQGGPLIVNHRDIRKLVGPKREECKISYLRGMVSQKGEGCAGHHAAHTLGIADEASGVEDITYTQFGTWTQRLLAFGNAMPSNGFFRKAIKGGDLPAKVG